MSMITKITIDEEGTTLPVVERFQKELWVVVQSSDS